MTDDSERRRLQAVLQFAAGAGSHGSDATTGQGDNATSEDRAWLREAIGRYTAGAFDPVDFMKDRLRLVYRFLQKDKGDAGETTEVTTHDVYEAIEEISDNCDHYDLAADLHKIGGFDLMIQGMQHKDAGVCWRSCEVLAVAVQNHEYCQNALIEMKALPIILRLIDDTTADIKVREKAFYALSCLVRGNDNGLDHLDEHDGFSVLIRAMQSDLAKLRLKSVFFVKAMCEADCKYSKLFHERGLEEQIIGMLRSHELEDNPENLNVLENILGCLCTLVLTYEESKAECSDPRLELSSTLRELKKKLATGGDEYEECVKFCDMILDSCFSDGDATATDR